MEGFRECCNWLFSFPDVHWDLPFLQLHRESSSSPHLGLRFLLSTQDSRCVCKNADSTLILELLRLGHSAL